MPVVKPPVSSEGPIDRQSVIQGLCGNRIMKGFFALEERVKSPDDTGKYSVVLPYILNSAHPFVEKALVAVYAKPDQQVREEGASILDEFNQRDPSRGLQPTVESFEELSRFETTGQYDLTQFLSGNAGNIYSVLKMAEQQSISPGLEAVLTKNLGLGLTVLRAIELEALG